MMRSKEQARRFKNAVHRTYQTIGNDAGLTGDESVVNIVEIVLDADHVMAFGGLSPADYADFRKFVDETIKQYGYKHGIHVLAHLLW